MIKTKFEWTNKQLTLIHEHTEYVSYNREVTQPNTTNVYRLSKSQPNTTNVYRWTTCTNERYRFRHGNEGSSSSCHNPQDRQHHSRPTSLILVNEPSLTESWTTTSTSVFVTEDCECDGWVYDLYMMDEPSIFCIDIYEGIRRNKRLSVDVISYVVVLLFIYYESTKRKLKTKYICGFLGCLLWINKAKAKDKIYMGCRCYERLQPNSGCR